MFKSQTNITKIKWQSSSIQNWKILQKREHKTWEIGNIKNNYRKWVKGKPIWLIKTTNDVVHRNKIDNGILYPMVNRNVDQIL